MHVFILSDYQDADQWNNHFYDNVDRKEETKNYGKVYF